MIRVEVVLRNPRWLLPFWLKAKALNSREQLVNAVVHTANSCMQTEIDSEEDPLFHELPLNILITWTRWWRLTAKALTLVLKKKVLELLDPT